jgi:conjugative relaxase-like TrwC/TraI family protein
MAVRVTTLKGPTAGEYYTRELELGRYYTGDVEPGRWIGGQANAFGLQGDVEPAAFLRLMAGLHPDTEVKLGRAYGESSARGYDVTFNAPKSVSLLAELCDGGIRAQVLAAHDAAIDRVFRFVDSQAHTRVTVQGVTSVVDARSLCVAGFRQHTSRAGDPHLHTHAVIIAKVHDEHGTWLALDARMVKHDQRTLSALYHLCLRAELTGRLGVESHEPVNGIAELVGIDEPVLSRFSNRTDQLEARAQHKIDRFRVTLGREPTDMERWRLEREAALDSRPAKTAADPRKLADQWRSELTALGLSPEALVAQVIGRHLEPTGIDAHQAAQIVTNAQVELTETVSTWRRNDLMREIARRVPTTVNRDTEELVAWVERVTDNVIARQVELAPPFAPDTPRRRDGRPITESTLDRHFTTEHILTEEEFLLTWALERQLPDGRPAHLTVAGLDRAQELAARTVAGTAGLAVIVGPAGAGKTSALRAAVDRLTADRRAVFGVTPSAAAAAVLGQQTGVVADTVDKLLYEHSQPGRIPSPELGLVPGTTLLVDEAGMIPTPKLARLARLADAHGWRVVLIGDPRQLGAVGRSGMFEVLVERGRVIELAQVHRFTHEWERNASLQLRRGDPDALTAYQSRSRLLGGTRIDMRRAALEQWRDDREHGDSVVMLAVTNDTVDALNTAAQAMRVAAGEVDTARRVTASNCVVHVGDEIVTRANNRQLRTDRGVTVRNRAQWTVTDIHRDGSVTAHNADGTVRLPADYLSTSVELGYAQTVHAAQGVTVDRCLLVVDGPIGGRALYVGMTRGRHSNRVYVSVDRNRTARDILEAALVADWSDTAAIAVRAELHARPLERLSRTPGLDPAALSTPQRLQNLRQRVEPPETGRGLGR